MTGQPLPAAVGPEAERLLAVSLDLLLIADFDYRIRRVEVTEGALAQGHHFSRPAAAEDVPALLGHVLGG